MKSDDKAFVIVVVSFLTTLTIIMSVGMLTGVIK